MIPLLNTPIVQSISREAPGESEFFEPNRWVMLGDVVVHHAHGFRFVICTLVHEPARVHIVGGGAKRRLTSWDREVGLSWYGASASRFGSEPLFAEVVERREAFLKDWERIPG